MIATVHPSPLNGRMYAIGSKSDIHRLLICAALADEPTHILGVTRSEDVEATARCIAGLGAAVEFVGSTCTVFPRKLAADNPHFDCGESGSTLRFLLPTAAAVCENASFSGRGRLPERPIGELVAAMRELGAEFSTEKLPLSINGNMRAGKCEIAGNISSQYISGLLMAMSVLAGESEIVLTSTLESAAYVDMTLHTLQIFGAEIETTSTGYRVRGKKSLKSPGTVRADGDWSNAAFFLCAGALAGEVSLSGLDPHSIQGDRAVCDILRRFGARVDIGEDSVTAAAAPLKGCTVDLTDIPDMLPALAVTAAFAEGETIFTGAARLRLKESDRLSTVAALINSLGGRAVEQPDGITVYGVPLKGGNVDGAGDHRIVMAAAAAAVCTSEEIIINGAEAVAKSYPRFFEDFAELGGKADVI